MYVQIKIRFYKLKWPVYIFAYKCVKIWDIYQREEKKIFTKAEKATDQNVPRGTSTTGKGRIISGIVVNFFTMSYISRVPNDLFKAIAAKK